MSPRKWLKWLTDQQYRAVRRWHRDHGDETLRLQYELGADDVVFDVGGYLGEYAASLAKTTQAQIHVFEPVKRYASAAQEATAHFENVTVHPWGLAVKPQQSEITLAGLASSRWQDNGPKEMADFRAIVDEIDAIAPNGLALLKLNIEGDEYDLLDTLMRTGTIEQIESLQVQFHLFEPNHKRQYFELTEQLKTSHRLTWRYPFVWENWQRISD